MLASSGPPCPDNGLHFAIITSPVRGHFNPLTALGAALCERGCRVTFVHVSDAAQLVGDRAVGFKAIGMRNYPPGSLKTYVELLGRATGLLGTLRMVRATARLCEMLCREAPQAIREIGATAILADVAEPAGALIARHMRLPYISVINGLPLHPDPIVPPPFINWLPDTSRMGRIRIQRAYRVTDLLMRPITDVLKRRARIWSLPGDSRNVLSPLLTVAQCPPGFDFLRQNVSPPIAWCGPFRPEEEENVDLPSDDGRPLIFCSLGTLQGGRHSLFRKIAGACADAGARAVIAHCGLLSEEQVASLPGDPVVRAFWPQRAVLQRVNAALVHGGFNTVLDTLAAGVPMVVVPIAFEQPGTAARLRAAGAAVVVPLRSLTRRRLAKALSAVLNQDSVKAGGIRLAARLEPRQGANHAADRIMDACLPTLRPTPAAASPSLDMSSERHGNWRTARRQKQTVGLQ